MDIIPTPKKNVIMDATTLSSLMSCARYMDLRFNHRFGAMKGRSNSLEVGSLIHKVLEVYYKHKLKGFKTETAIGQAMTAGKMYIDGCPFCSVMRTDEDGNTIKPECGHEIEEYPGVTNTPENSSGFTTGWKFALDTCEQYFIHYRNDALIPLSAEDVRAAVLYEDDEIRIMWKAKFDLVVDTNQIGIVSLDHKTFKQRRAKSSLSNQFMGHCMLLSSRNVIKNNIGLQTTLKIEERLTREVISYSADRLIEWQSEILPYYAYKYIQFTETGFWPPDFTHCDNMFGACQFKSVCESNREMREEVLRNEFQILPIWDPTNKKDED